MKEIKNNAAVFLIFAVVALIIIIFNLFLNVYPILDLFKFLESKNIYWVVPIVVLVIAGLWLYNKSIKNRILNERIEIFNATIRTMQDILQNSASSMQLLILDMKDLNIHEDIVVKAEKNIEELKAVIKTLADVDPKTIELKELNNKLSVISMEK